MGVTCRKLLILLLLTNKTEARNKFGDIFFIVQYDCIQQFSNKPFHLHVFMTFVFTVTNVKETINSQLGHTEERQF